MDNNTVDLLAQIDELSSMIEEAWSMPVGNGKCIIDKDKATEIISKIREQLPGTVSEAKKLVDNRDTFIGNAKREAEAMRKSAEEKAKALIEEQEIVRRARAESEQILSDAENKSQTLRRMASDYVNELMKNAEAQLSEALGMVRNSHDAFNRQLRTATISSTESSLSRATSISRIDEDEEE